jgi:hypothetical protein
LPEGSCLVAAGSWCCCKHTASEVLLAALLRQRMVTGQLELADLLLQLYVLVLQGHVCCAVLCWLELIQPPVCAGSAAAQGVINNSPAIGQPR